MWDRLLDLFRRTQPGEAESVIPESESSEYRPDKNEPGKSTHIGYNYLKGLDGDYEDSSKPVRRFINLNRLLRAITMEKLNRLMKKREATYVEKTPSDSYRDVAQGSDLTADEVASIGGLESNHGKFDKPIKGGSARGLYQFQPDTAEHLAPGSSGTLDDTDTQSKLMKLYLEKNNTENVEDAFVKHNLGASRGGKFIAAGDDELVSSVLPARVIRANPGLYSVKTVGEARQKIKDKLKEGNKDSEVQPNFLDLFKGK